MFEITERIVRCQQQGRKTLDEAESKRLLAAYGVPVVADRIATTAGEAETLARDAGFPVVLKGLGSRLTHKTERGLVKTGLHTAEAVREAFEAIRTAGGGDWEGCLVQPMIKGRREFAAGLMHDPQFGPVVMFGLGGIFTEAIGDVVFRIAPIEESEARRMTGELSARDLLGYYRGEAAADADQIARVLTGLSRLAMEHPEVREVDINPLIVSQDGRVTAVDALVILDENQGGDAADDPSDPPCQARATGIQAALDAMVHPCSIAVLGAARTPTGGYPGMFACIRDFGFPGSLYPVNPNAEEIDGVKAYPSLTALPGPVDLVIISLPAHLVPAALRDCIASGNKNVHIFSSGFKETGEPEGIRLHGEIERIAVQRGLHVVGPNCMGIHVPESRLLTWKAAPAQSGPLAFISQSGGHAQDFTCYASSCAGLFLSKVISYGNALTLDSPDFLEYLGEDDKTGIIAVYLEGVKDGRRLLRLAAEVNRKKPVILLKAGLTESGARTVASHTGSMAGGESIWNAFYRQTGVIRADSLEEMAETAMALHYLPKWTGKNLVILGSGGGIGVAAADSCAKAGLNLPALSPSLLEELRKYIPPAGNMIRNPIDAHVLLYKLELMGPVLELLSMQGDLDMFLFSLHFDWLHSMEDGGHLERIAEYIATEARQHTKGKPLAVAWRQYQPNPAIRQTRKKVERMLIEAGVPAFNGLERALSALAKAEGYHAFVGQSD